MTLLPKRLERLRARSRSPNQALPLQDLSYAGETNYDGRDWEDTTSGRTPSPRGLQIIYGPRGAYSPVAEPSIPQPTSPRPRAPLRIVNSDQKTPMVGRVGIEEEDGNFSPIATGVGYLGLGIEYDDEDIGVMSFNALPPVRRSRDTGQVRNRADSYEMFPSLEDGVAGSYEPHRDESTDRLNDPRHQQQPGMLPLSTPQAQRSNQNHTRSVSFNRSRSPRPHARLGDELPKGGDLEEGRRRRSTRSRSLTPSTPLERASTILVNASRRMVNLSNEPDLANSELRRRSSYRQQPDTFDEQSKEAVITEEAQTNGHLDGNTSRTNLEPVPGPPLAYSDVDWFRKPQTNPFRDKSLWVFSPDNAFRAYLCDLLIHPFTEPVILLLIVAQTVLLAIQSAPDVFVNGRDKSSKFSAIDYALLVLFVAYTVEIMIRVIVSGFIINPEEYSTIDRGKGLRRGLRQWLRRLFALPSDQLSSDDKTHIRDTAQQSIMERLAGAPRFDDTKGEERHRRRMRLAHRAFLRHSFTRFDFLAVVAYWISFVLIMTGVETSKRLYTFDMLSSLRILRLLSLTKGTTIILRSLKKAAPLLLNVALLIGFFWLLFAIIGVQSFNSSLRRYCNWYAPADAPVTGYVNDAQNYTSNQLGSFQFCGGSVTSNGTRMPYYLSDGVTLAPVSPKGYLCPPNSYCIVSDNPYDGTVSFDNIFQSLELVFVTMTGNTYTDLMYYLASSDYLLVCLFFAAAIVIMTFWLINLLIAVITSSFQVIREESETSAFSEKPAEEDLPEPEPHAPNRSRPNVLKEIYDYTRWIWLTVIVYGLVVQCLRSSSMGPRRRSFIDGSETIVTFLLLFEILLRFAADWRGFIKQKTNWTDLFLAVVTSIMQLPTIRHSGQPYDWLTFFQIARIYRVVLAITWIRELIILVFGNTSGLLNLILFVFLLTFLAAILAAQLFRGTLPQYPPNGDPQSPIHITFNTIWNSFIGMYQILSSENWTVLLYNVTMYNDPYDTAWMGAIFLILWFTLSFFIVLNMFIAVIQENFDVSEDDKRVKQFEAFLQQKELGSSSNPTLSLSTIFRPGRFGRRHQDPLDYGPAIREQLLEGAVQAFVGDTTDGAHGDEPMNGHAPEIMPSESRLRSFLPDNSRIARIPAYFSHLFGSRETNPFYSRPKFTGNVNLTNPVKRAQAANAAAVHRKQAQLDYLAQHPTYNKSLFIFKYDNPIRKWCQKLVGPGRGSERIEGVAPSVALWYIFNSFIYAVILAMVLLACVTTPVFQKSYFIRETGGRYTAWNWFTFTDLGFAAVFTIEALIRIIADGLFFTPHAYYRSSWGFIDGVVLITLWLNVITALANEGAVSRAVGAFKALRALRLLNISDSARETFHAVIIRGGWKVITAALVSLSLLIPFAIYGLNLFNGQMLICNDQQYFTSPYLNNCVNEWASSPFQWNVTAPHRVANPYYSFDNFGDSLSILFQIVSQEGWTDVMWSAEQITGVGLQPQSNSRPGNAVFFILFNLLGSVFVLTLFISVFMRNYTEQTGVAFLTAEQRSWLELRKRLSQLRPTKRPRNQKRGYYARKCYKLAIQRSGWWQRLVTTILVLHLLLLCAEFYSVTTTWDDARSYILFCFTLFYAVNLGVRIYGLTWARFSRNAWDLYALIAVPGTIIVTVFYFVNLWKSNGVFEPSGTLWQTLHKLFLVLLVLLLIPRNSQLDQLFKTAAASLSAIVSLLATWFVLFLVFAIAMTQTFGLTRFNANETGNVNFRDVPRALILLFRMSTGEGWNQIMTDYATVVPPLCTVGANFLDTDCGSFAWAYALFIAWNILSMYIFVNMFISLIFESFSYVYQRHSGLAEVGRSELRRFKEAWAEYDPDATGYIKKEDLPKLMRELSGVFEMRIYPPEFSVRTILDECRVDPPPGALPIMQDGPARVDLESLDLRKLNEKLAKMPMEEIRQRRDELNAFNSEVLRSAVPDRGIWFTALIMILAHYKIITDTKNLRLDEFLRRRRRLQYVKEDVQRAIVRSWLDTVHQKLKFRRAQEIRKSGRLAGVPVPAFEIPEILVEDEEDRIVSPMSPRMTERPNLTISIPQLNSITIAATSGASPTVSSPHAILRQRGDSAFTSPTTGMMSYPTISITAEPSLTLPHETPARDRAVSNVSMRSDSGWNLGPTSGPGIYDVTGFYDGPPSPLESDGYSRTLDISNSHTTGGTVELQLLSPTSRANGTLSAEDALRPRARTNPKPNPSTVEQAAQEVWEALGPWGHSLRRSFSVRHPELFDADGQRVGTFTETSNTGYAARQRATTTLSRPTGVDGSQRRNSSRLLSVVGNLRSPRSPRSRTISSVGGERGWNLLGVREGSGSRSRSRSGSRGREARRDSISEADEGF